MQQAALIEQKALAVIYHVLFKREKIEQNHSLHINLTDFICS